MKCKALHKMLSLLLAILLMGTVLLTGCQPANPSGESGESTDAPAAGEVADEHNHKESAISITYTNHEGGTLVCTVKNCKGEVLFTKSGLTNKCLSERFGSNVISLCWVLNNNPGGYECVYIDKIHCRVSPVYTGEQATDGTRVVYTEKIDGALNMVIRDLFDKEVYYDSKPLTDAYMGGEYTVLSARIKDKTIGYVSYLVDDAGAHRVVSYDMYPDTTTAKTEAKK